MVPTRFCFISMIVAVTTPITSSLSTKTTTTRGVSTWSDVAIKTAKDLTISQRARLQATGITNIKRPITITAQRIRSAEDSFISDPTATNTITKIIHFQRHAQGYHNLIGDVYRGLGNKIDLDDPNPATNPFVRPEILDSPLTELGCQQSRSQRVTAAQLSPEVIIVSPLQRAIETALLSFVDCQLKGVAFVAHEGCREQLGLLQCNKRRCLSDITQSFPMIDFSNIATDDDDMWSPTERESPLEEADRVYNFLTEFIMERSETELAVVGHSAWLFNMLNAVVDCGEDEEVAEWFLTSEIRSLRMTFEKRGGLE